MMVETPEKKAKCIIQQVNRTNLTAAGDGVKLKIHKNGEEEGVTISVEVEDADGRKRLDE